MFATSKALTSNVKSIVSKLIFNGFAQSKNGPVNNLANSNGILASENSKTKISNMAQNFSFGITYAKHVSEISQEASMNAHLKRIQKTGTSVHCFNPRTHHEEDVPIRILRTHYTVTFLPSEQFLEKEFHSHKGVENSYHPEKDSTLSLHKFNCKHCGHHETRSFPENGYKYGTVITGCDQCHEVMVVSDHLGWIEEKKEKHSTDLIFSKKQVHDLIRRNLKKVGIDGSKDEALD